MYNSLEYYDYEDLSTYTILHEEDDLLLLIGYNKESTHKQYHWACNHIDVFKQALKGGDKDILITFVPKEWVEDLQDVGFQLYAVWNDYFCHNINDYHVEADYIVMEQTDYKEVSNVTLACRGQSRGFDGQTSEWVMQWFNGQEPARPSYATHSTILVKKVEDEIAGIICLATYGTDSDKGVTLWIREVAVHPKYQRRGIARELITQAYEYGISLGAKRAFLMADECNKNAIGLYKSMGFIGNPEEAEYNMIRL